MLPVQINVDLIPPVVADNNAARLFRQITGWWARIDVSSKSNPDGPVSCDQCCRYGPKDGDLWNSALHWTERNLNFGSLASTLRRERSTRKSRITAHRNLSSGF
jgi:hypothetical protein